jgi:hypothetical protein
MEELQYPIGKFVYGKTYCDQEVKEAISELKALVLCIRRVLIDYKSDDFKKSYRNGGWTAIQLINHLCDVYINAYLRTKWLLTEDTPALKPYDQDAFSALPDGSYKDIYESLDLLETLIKRWTYLLASISNWDFQKQIYHPENDVLLPLDELVIMYKWHGYHHLAHLEIIKSEPK